MELDRRGWVYVVVGGGAFWQFNTRASVVQVDAPLPADFPEQGFSHRLFEQLLQRFVRDGRVDYQAWHADKSARLQLDRYLAAIAAYSPDSHPQRFPEDNAALAYWMYAYNAFVIKAVLERWPLTSVTDVKAPVELVQGLGFFYTLKFVAGGVSMRLYDLEHDKVLKPSKDPRVHFVLNCGSGGCPVIRPTLPTGAELEKMLDDATIEFVTDPRNVAIDDKARTIKLSTIFKWYKADFVNAVRRRGLPSQRGAVAYVEMVAPDPLKEQLAAAHGYRVEFEDYDWSINAAP